MDRIEHLLLLFLVVVILVVLVSQRVGAMGGRGCASGPATLSTVPDDPDAFGQLVYQATLGGVR